jgi:hypothetical protein
MITGEFRQTLARVREAIDSSEEWSIFNSVPAGVSRLPELDAPEEYLDFLLAADGAIMGSVVILDRKFAEKSQALISPGMVEVPEDPGNWFVVGKVNENPVLANRRDGSIWTYPDMMTSSVHNQIPSAFAREVFRTTAGTAARGADGSLVQGFGVVA